MRMYTVIGGYSCQNGGLDKKISKICENARLRDEKLLFFYPVFDIMLSIENYLGGLNR